MGCAYLYMVHVVYPGFARSFTTCRNYVMYVLLAHITTHTEQWSYYVTLLLIIVEQVFVLSVGRYGRAQYVCWVVHQTIVRALIPYLFLMKDIYSMFPPTYVSCDYCCVTFVSLFMNLRHPRDFTSHTSWRGTLYVYTDSKQQRPFLLENKILSHKFFTLL